MTTKECLIDFLRNEQKQMNIMFYCNDFEFADRLFKLIKNNVKCMYSNFNDKNENMKEELKQLMQVVEDYSTGYGGVEDDFVMTEIMGFAKDYHQAKLKLLDIHNVSKQRELLIGYEKAVYTEIDWLVYGRDRIKNVDAYLANL